MATPKQEKQIRQLLRRTGGVGIVYAATVAAVEELYAMLQQSGASVTRYHHLLPADERRDNQQLFISGARRVMVATAAFDPGVANIDRRFVIHLQDDKRETVALTVGSQLPDAKFDLAAILSVAGDRIAIEYPENSTKTFMAEFVDPF